MSDLDDLLNFINSLVDEGAQILLEERTTREAEADWLGRLLADIEKNAVVDVVAEVDGLVVANSEMRRETGKRNHVGTLGIAIRDGYRGIGIGTEMLRVLIDESKKMGLKLLRLSVFEPNRRARHIYEKVGFREVGKFPGAIRAQDDYVDEVHMALVL